MSIGQAMSDNLEYGPPSYPGKLIVAITHTITMCWNVAPVLEAGNGGNTGSIYPEIVILELGFRQVRAKRPCR